MEHRGEGGKNVLHSAVESGMNFFGVDKILKQLINNKRKRFIEFSTISRHFDFVEDEIFMEALIKTGANTNIRDNNGNTPLHLASTKGKIKISLYNSNSPNIIMNLIILYRIGNSNIAQILIVNRADTDAIDNDGNTALHKAASSGKLFVLVTSFDKKTDHFAIFNFFVILCWTFRSYQSSRFVG